MKTLLFRSLIGIFFGGFLAVLVTTAIALLNDLETLNAAAFINSALGFIFCGWFFSVTPLYFEKKNWSLLRQTMYHFITVLTLYFITAFFLGWITFTLQSLFIFSSIFLGVYAAIWSGFYWYYSNEAKKMTKELEDL